MQFVRGDCHRYKLNIKVSRLIYRHQWRTREHCTWPKKLWCTTASWLSQHLSENIFVSSIILRYDYWNSEHHSSTANDHRLGVLVWWSRWEYTDKYVSSGIEKCGTMFLLLIISISTGDVMCGLMQRFLHLLHIFVWLQIDCTASCKKRF